jgi:NADH:ubiquinone oxidoreductase subunit C
MKNWGTGMGLKFFIFSLEKINFIIEFILSSINLLNFIIIKNNYFYLFIEMKNLICLVKFLVKSNFFIIKNLHDIVIVDYPGEDSRFKLIYHFSSYIYNFRIFITFFVNYLELVPSIIHIFNSAN